ncbi:MAG: fatty acid--CoA ligase family protein [Verrucomicrobia bacterium]|nr:fatty acid--CoA ligase family protein [Verrucomicrobiota bacterium]
MSCVPRTALVGWRHFWQPSDTNGRYSRWIRIYRTTSVATSPDRRAAKVIGSNSNHPIDWQPHKYPPDTALLKSTSGSTGEPKLFAFSAGAMLADGKHIIEGMKLQPNDVHYAHIAFGHSYGLGNLVMPLVIQGAAIALSSGFLPRTMIEDLRGSKATVFPTVPAVIRAFAESEAAAELPNTIRLVISAGGKLSPKIASKFATVSGRKVHNFYGSTETGGIAFDGTTRFENSIGHVGLPLPGVSVRILDKSARIEVSSAAISDTFTTLDGRRSHVLYDSGCWLPDGQLLVYGRCDRDVKIGGKRLSMSEVESALLSIPEVTMAWVHVLPGDNEEPQLIAAVTTDITLIELKSRLAGLLPAWKRPRRWLRLESFPLNTRGKVDGRALVKMFQEQRT